jgi:hypothetical protein
VKVVNRAPPAAAVAAPVRASPDEPKLFAPEGSAGGCASGECLPEVPLTLTASPAPATAAPALPAAPVVVAAEPLPADEPEELPARVETEHDRWARAVEALRQSSPRHGKSLSYARFLGFTPEGVRVAFSPDAAFHKAQVTGMSRAIVEAELTRTMGRAMKLLDESNTTAYQAAPKSIAEVEASDRQTRETGIDRKVREHPAIRTILKHLGGAVEHIAYLEPAQTPRTVAPAGADDTTTPEE